MLGDVVLLPHLSKSGERHYIYKKKKLADGQEQTTATIFKAVFIVFVLGECDVAMCVRVEVHVKKVVNGITFRQKHPLSSFRTFSSFKSRVGKQRISKTRYNNRLWTSSNQSVDWTQNVSVYIVYVCRMSTRMVLHRLKYNLKGRYVIYSAGSFFVSVLLAHWELCHGPVRPSTLSVASVHDCGMSLLWCDIASDIAYKDLWCWMLFDCAPFDALQTHSHQQKGQQKTSKYFSSRIKVKIKHGNFRNDIAR